jgi:urease accessory protein
MTYSLNPDLVSLQSTPSTWLAKSSLVFHVRYNKTVLKSLKTEGPLYVQKLFYPEEESANSVIPAHCYSLHPPGGLVSGDSLETELTLETNSHVLFTTPGATKIYKARDNAKQNQRVKAVLKENAVLEYFPMETIVFSGANAKMDLSFNLHKTATLLSWDILCFGRPESNETFDAGCFEQNMEIKRDDKLLSLDRLALNSNKPNGLSLLNSELGLNKKPYYGVFTAITNDENKLEKARQNLTLNHNDTGGVTIKTGVLFGRIINRDIEPVKLFLKKLWAETRMTLLNLQPNHPRIWNT